MHVGFRAENSETKTNTKQDGNQQNALSVTHAAVTHISSLALYLDLFSLKELFDWWHFPVCIVGWNSSSQIWATLLEECKINLRIVCISFYIVLCRVGVSSARIKLEIPLRCNFIFIYFHTMNLGFFLISHQCVDVDPIAPCADHHTWEEHLAIVLCLFFLKKLYFYFFFSHWYFPF